MTSSGSDPFFNQYLYFPESSDHYLDLNEYLQYDSTPNTHEADVEEPPIRKLSDPFGSDPVFIPFDPRRSAAENEPIFTPVVFEAEPAPREERVAPSIVTKNVCFNICQKTVKVIQKDTYAEKLDQICAHYGVEKAEFVAHILKQKKNFTGPKALQIYIDQESPLSAVFRDFMRWFLKEKYLRHCLTGDMDNKEAYIKYKNEVILVILG